MKKLDKALSNQGLQMFFRVLNKDFFENKIPLTRVRFGKIKEEGLFTPDGIIINQHLRKFPDLVTLVLLHEMNHAYIQEKGYTGFINGGHSIIFDVGIDRLYRAGAYEGIL